jgi:hypothetical protein
VTAPALTALLPAFLAARQSGGGRAALQTALAQAAEEDPNLALLAQFIGDRPEPEPEVAVLPEPDPRAEWRRATVAELRGAIRELEAECEELHARGEVLAAGLGACAACWGVDLSCPTCAGNGRPGWRVPDPDVFAEWVAPAVKRARRHRTTTRPSPGIDGGSNGV